MPKFVFEREDGTTQEIDALSVQDSMKAVAGEDPNSVAEIRNLSKKLKVRPEIVIENIPLARKIASSPDLSILDNTAPVLAGLSRDYGFMALSSDDLTNLARFEQKSENIKNVLQADSNKKAEQLIYRKASKWIPDFVKESDMYKEFVSGMAIDDLGLLGNIKKELRAKGQDLTPVQEKELEELQLIAQYNSTRGGIAGAFGSASEMLGQMFQANNSKYDNPLAFGLATGAAMAGGAAAVSGPAAPFTASAGFVSGLTAGYTAGMFKHSAKVEGGMQYLDSLEMKGEDGQLLSEREKQIASDAVGLINGSLELVGFSQMVKLVPGLKKVLNKGVENTITKNPTVQQALSKYAKNVAAGVTAETATETLQEMTNVFAEGFLQDKEVQEIVNDPATAERLKDIMSKVAQGTLVLGGLGGGINLAGDIRTARKYQKAVEAHEAIVDTLEAGELSALKNRSQDDFSAFAQRVGEQNGIDKVYFQADRMFEEATKKGITVDELPAWLEEIGVKRDDFTVALETGGTVEVDYGKAMSAMKSDDVMQGLRDDIQINADTPAMKNLANDLLAENEAMVRLTELYTEEQNRLIGNNDLDNWKEAVLANEAVSKVVKPEMLELMSARANAKAKISGRSAVDYINEMLSPYNIKVMKYDEFLNRKRFDVENDAKVLAETYGVPLDFAENNLTEFAMLIPMIEMVRGGEAGGRVFNEDGTVSGYSSSFPNWFRNLGISKKEALNIFDKIRAMKPLTSRQQYYYEKMLEGVRQEVVDDYERTGGISGRVVDDTEPMFQSAWHGSPHKFDKFSLSSVGTGEGNQAFGYGLYFAGSKDIAEHYRNKLAGESIVKVKADMYDVADEKQWILKAYNIDEDLLFKTPYLSEDELSSWVGDEYSERIKSIEDGVIDDIIYSPGRLYKVELAPAEDEYLLWDKPLSEQSEKVRKILEDWRKAVGASFHDGETAYKEFVFNARMAGSLNENKTASEELLKLGIRGVKYLDGVSRIGQERETYNYVVFSDDDVEIQEFYQKQGKEMPRGAFYMENDQNVIALFENKNKSTFLHEMGHLFLNDLKDFAENEGYQVDTWNAVKQWLEIGEDGVIKREQHEKFAEYWEVYLMEGKAPSLELRNAFRMFKTWLTKIYESVNSKLFGRYANVKINPEIRDIFDRLIATDAEIQQAREDSALIAMLDDKLLNNTGFTADEIEEYKRVVMASEDAAKEKRDNRKLTGLRERVAQWTKEASEEADNISVYAFIKKVRGIVGVNKASIDEKYGKDGIPSTSSIYKKDGIDIDLAVAQFGEAYGYQETGDFITDFKNMQPKNQWIKKRVAQKEAEYVNEQSSDEAIRTASLRRMLEIESEWLNKQVEKQEKTEAERIINQQIRKGINPRSVLRKWADNIVSQRNIKQVNNIGKLLSESRQHRQKAIKFARQQKWSEALDSNEKARMTEELIASSLKAKNEFVKMQKAWTRAVNSKSMLSSYQQQLFRLMKDYGATGRKLDIRPDTPDFLSFIGELNANANEIDIVAVPALPEWMANEFVPLSEMTWTQIQDFNNMISWLYHKGIDELKQMKADEKGSIANMREECLKDAERVKTNKIKTLFPQGSKMAQIQSFVRDYFARNQLFLFMMRQMDGYQNIGSKGKAGANERNIFRPIMDGIGRKMDLQKQVNEKIKPHIEHLTKRVGEKFNFPLSDEFKRYNYQWTWERIVAVALNMGNTSNKSRLLNGFTYDGEKMSEEQIFEIVGELTEKDWQAVQGIWDAIDSLYPDLNDVHKKINYFPMKKIQAEAFDVITADGKNITVNGGYYPIKFDPVLDKSIAQWTEKDEILNSQEAIRQVPNPKSGMTKDRAGNNVQRPLKLDMSVLSLHIDDVTNYIGLAKPIKDADRITNNSNYSSRAEEVLGIEGQALIRNHLKGIIRPSAVPKNKFETAIEKSRVLFSAYTMGYNFWTAVQNITGVFPLIRDIGLPQYINGVSSVMQNPRKAYESMLELSPYMRSRMQNIDRDIHNEVNKFKPQMSIKGLTIEDIRTAGFYGIRAVDMANALPSWWGAYNKALRDGMDSVDAVKYADTKIQSSQGSGLSIDLSDNQRSQGLMRLLTNFMTFAVTQQNIMSQDIRALREGAISKKEFINGVMMVIVMPAVSTVILRSALADGEPPEPDDIAENLASYLVMGLPGVRDVLAGAIRGISDEKKYQQTFKLPAFEVMTKSGEAVTETFEIWKDEDRGKAWHELIWAYAETVSMITGVPASKVYKKAVRGFKQIEEEDGHIWNILIPSDEVRVTKEELFLEE